jgi:GAF domain-containing protein
MQRCAADAPFLAATSSRLLHTIKPILEALLAHYDSCEYVLVSFHDDNAAHIPCGVSRAGGAFAAVTPHHRGLSFCMTTLQRPIPVIISPILHSARFSEHPLVVGPPYLTSFVGVPLIHAGAYYGALCIFWTGDGGCVNDIRAYAEAEAAATKVSDLLVAHLNDMTREPQ